MLGKSLSQFSKAFVLVLLFGAMNGLWAQNKLDKLSKTFKRALGRHGFVHLNKLVKNSQGRLCLKITAVYQDARFVSGKCPARQAGLKHGDLIESVNGKTFKSYQEARALIKANRIELRVSSSSSARTVSIRREALKRLPVKKDRRNTVIAGHGLVMVHPKSWSVTNFSVDPKTGGKALSTVNNGCEFFVEIEPRGGVFDRYVTAWIERRKGSMAAKCRDIEVSQCAVEKSRGRWILVKFKYHLKQSRKTSHEWRLLGCLEDDGYARGGFYHLGVSAERVQGELPDQGIYEEIFQSFDFFEAIEAEGARWRTLQIPGHPLSFRLPKSWSVTLPETRERAKTFVLRAGQSLKKTLIVECRASKGSLDESVSDYVRKRQESLRKAGVEYKVIAKTRLLKSRGQWLKVRARKLKKRSWSGYKPFETFVFGALEGQLYAFKFQWHGLGSVGDLEYDRDFPKVIESFQYSKSSLSFEDKLELCLRPVFSNCVECFRRNKSLSIAERHQLWACPGKATEFLLKNFKGENKNLRYRSLGAIRSELTSLLLSSRWPKVHRAIVQNLLNDTHALTKNLAFETLLHGVTMASAMRKPIDLTEADEALLIEHFWPLLKSGKNSIHLIEVLSRDLGFHSPEFLSWLKNVVRAGRGKILVREAKKAIVRVEQAMRAEPRPKPSAKPRPRLVSPKSPGPRGSPPKTGRVICRSCQRQLKADSKFCDGCGHKVGPPKCHKCQRQLKTDSKFCDGCGTKQK